MSEQMLQSAKMRLASEAPGSLAFRPRLGWPLLVALSRMISGENVKLSFSASDGGTQVAVSGKVAGAAEKVANREFWAETLAAPRGARRAPLARPASIRASVTA